MAAIHKRTTSAPRVLVNFCGTSVLPIDLDILRPFSIDGEPVRQHAAIGRPAMHGHGRQQRAVKPPAMLIGAFEIQIRWRHDLGAAVV